MSEMAIEYERRRISVADYHRMDDAGIFDPDERVELLDGELIAVPRMGSRHAGAVGAIARLLSHRLYDVAFVRVQLPVVVDEYSEPEPDIAAVAFDAGEYRERHPSVADVLLLIEASDTTRDYDLRKKGPIYARAGIREYWVVDVAERHLLVHREPAPFGYALTRVLRPGETVSPLAFPGERFEVVALTG